MEKSFLLLLLYIIIKKIVSPLILTWKILRDLSISDSLFGQSYPRGTDPRFAGHGYTGHDYIPTYLRSMDHRLPAITIQAITTYRRGMDPRCQHALQQIELRLSQIRFELHLAGIYSHGPYSSGVYNYGIYRYGLCSHGLLVMAYIGMPYIVLS